MTKYTIARFILFLVLIGVPCVGIGICLSVLYSMFGVSGFLYLLIYITLMSVVIWAVLTYLSEDDYDRK